jgi:hypothetical protein
MKLPFRPPAIWLIGGLAAGHGPTSHRLVYTVLVPDRVQGHEINVSEPGGTRTITYRFNDRGRGTDIQSHYRLDGDGFPSIVEITGRNYDGAEGEEHFRVESGRASWKSNAEQGRSSKRGYYLSVNGAPGELAWLVAALLGTAHHRIPVLPQGEASLSRGGALTLASHGQTVRVTYYLIAGLNYHGPLPSPPCERCPC